jgi:hypothetical protein
MNSNYPLLPEWVPLDHHLQCQRKAEAAAEPGAKDDAGKYRPGLVLGGFANALLAVSVVGTDGAKKYTDGGWKIVPNGEARYVDAALRHLLDDLRGYKVDSDSGSLHLAHAAWNLLAVIELRSEHPCP